MKHKLNINVAKESPKEGIVACKKKKVKGRPYKSSGGKLVYNEKLKREIPENWSIDELLNVVDWESNSQPPKSEFSYENKEGYIRFIQNRDYDSDAHITYIPLTKNLSLVDELDILIDKYGDAGALRYGIKGAFNVALGKATLIKMLSL